MVRRVEQVQRGLFPRLIHHSVLRDPLVIFLLREDEEFHDGASRRTQQRPRRLALRRLAPRAGLVHGQTNLEHELAAIVEVPPRERARGGESRGFVERNADAADDVRRALRGERVDRRAVRAHRCVGVDGRGGRSQRGLDRGVGRGGEIFGEGPAKVSDEGRHVVVAAMEHLEVEGLVAIHDVGEAGDHAHVTLGEEMRARGAPPADHRDFWARKRAPLGVARPRDRVGRGRGRLGSATAAARGRGRGRGRGGAHGVEHAAREL